MNKKGFTTVELIVSFTLISIIVFFLFEIIFALKNIYISSGIRTKLLTKQTIITENINDDFVSKNLIAAARCTDNTTDNACIDFTFDDGVRRLIVNRDNKTITYNNVTTSLIDGSKIGNIKITSETVVNTDDYSKYDGILSINIPIYHTLIEKENFGISIVHQYNSSITSVSNINITDIVDAEKQVYLIGSSEDIKFQDNDYDDSGFYVYDNTTNQLITDKTVLDGLVEVTGEVGNELGRTYYKTYTVYDMNKNIMSQVTRQITVVSSEYTYDYDGSTSSLFIPVDGRYKIELWGAAGGGSSLMKGLGGYTVGEFTFKKDELLYINVGGKGRTGTANLAATGGYNGGGASGVSDINFASSGGGSTDIRFNSKNLDARIMVAGGGGGGGSKNDSVATCNGGSGGGTTGTKGKCSADSYLGGAGTQSAGGAKASYTENITTLPTNGVAGGGGGGYYGGGGGARFGGGGGGSGYCSNTAKTCTLYDGTSSFPAIDNKTYETGHDGNGYIKITLISLITE